MSENLKKVTVIQGANTATVPDYSNTWYMLEAYNAESMCMHDTCSQCKGSGRKGDGTSCVHMISCPCPKCSPRC